MTKAQHTPGPWETDSNGKIWGDVNNETLDGDSPLLAEMFGNGKEQRANGLLIATAPDFLTVAMSLLEVLQRFGEWDDGCFYYAGRASPELERPMRELAATIAKARGEKELAA